MLCLLVGVASLLGTGIAFADGFADCTQPSDMPRAVAGCTDLIEAATTTQHLAIAYRNRSSAYAALGEFERAEQDSQQAITLNPGYVTAPSEGLFAASRR